MFFLQQPSLSYFNYWISFSLCRAYFYKRKEWQLHNLHKTFATCLIEQIACLAIERRVKNRCMFDQTHCLKRKWSLLASLLSRATVVSYEGYSQKNFSIPKFSEELETKLDTQDIRLSFQEWFHVYTWPSAALRIR